VGVKEFAVYTVARLGLFVASYVIVAGVWLLAAGGHGVPMLWPFFIAVVISAIASYYLLRRPRDKFALMVDRRASAAASAASERLEKSRAKEDADD
jgi:TRAP-type C4-dicarboxylate transport system permease small subunit